MIKCSVECEPCCDFCIYAIHEEFESHEEIVKGGPIGCRLHEDQEHQEIAEQRSYCDDFHCFLAKN